MTELLVSVALALALAVPLAMKWQLGVRRVALVVGLLAVACGAAVGAVDAGSALLRGLVGGIVALVIATGILAWRFYRDPERRPPADDDVLVSPADGEVVYVREARAGVLPMSTKLGRDYDLEELTRTPLVSGDAVVIGIAMSFLDVHVNRAPLAGRVVLRRHFPGLFGSLRDETMVFRNERATTVIERNGTHVAIVQIASRLVRQIASFVEEGQHVGLGQRIGVIRLGSQVDVVVPVTEGLEIGVTVGDRVRAGESVLAVLGAGADRAAPVAARGVTGDR